MNESIKLLLVSQCRGAGTKLSVDGKQLAQRRNLLKDWNGISVDYEGIDRLTAYEMGIQMGDTSSKMHHRGFRAKSQI